MSADLPGPGRREREARAETLVAAGPRGAPCWLSLTARDLEAAEGFYGDVLGWTFRPGGLGSTFSVAELDGVPVAGLGAMAAELAAPVAWTAYFRVDSADEAAARVRERGGTVGVGPVSYPPRGRAALVADRDGAGFGIWEGPVLAGWRVGGGGAPAWLELLTRDAFEAALFYGPVLQWAEDDPGSCVASYEDDQVVLRSGGEAVARLNSGPVEAAAEKSHERPRWLVHFRVPEVQEAQARALARGATEVPGPAGPGRAQVTLRDPQGALFTLDRPADETA
ncbi:VOC family protein [Streptomyces sp. NPDC031705]|uniref:VOC family protein n=1 Tax=Streptomyces sp. NPDC031705 TaxID=3155729 RepID=UPI003400BD82